MKKMRLCLVGLLALMAIPTPSSGGWLSSVFRLEARTVTRAEAHVASRVATRTELRASEESARLTTRSSARPATHMAPMPSAPAIRSARGASFESAFSVRASSVRSPAPRLARPAERELTSRAQANAPLNFNKDIRGKMRRRGWTQEQVYEAIQSGKPFPRPDGSVRYLHPQTGKSVVIDSQTGKIYQVGKKGFAFNHREAPAPRTPPKKP